MKLLKTLFLSTLALGVTAVCITSCSGSKQKAAETDATPDSIPSDTAALDTAAIVDNTPVSDTERYLSERPMPKTADELFDDFFFTFSNSRKIQKERTRWPLQTFTNGEEGEIQENHWQMERFYADEGFYVLLLNNEKDVKLAKDTAVHSVVVEHVNINEGRLKNFIFNKIDGKWQMTQIEEEALSESNDAKFLSFYMKFATDSIFCAESLESSIRFTGPDLDDENATTTRDITADEYFDWAPELATDFFAITYGQKDEDSDNKVFVMRQPASSQECRLSFRRKAGTWRLYKLEE